MRSGDLLVEVASRKQAQQSLKLNSLSTIPVSVKPHLTLNTSKGVITCGRLLNLSILGNYAKIDWSRGYSSFTHSSFSRACPKWELEKEIVTLKFKNNISFPEARRLVKARTPIEGQSYASVVDKNHPVYQITNCPHCHHVVTMSNFPSASKSSEPIASSSTTPNRNTSHQSSSKTPEVSPASKDPSGFQIVQNEKKPKLSSKIQSVKNNQLKPDTASKFLKKSLSASVVAQDKSSKNKNDINETSNANAVNLPSDSSRGNSSDSESDLSVTSAPEVSKILRETGLDRNLRSYTSLNKQNVDFSRRISLQN
ncbi:hypothetical protein AVEN_73107-1 [Araneus ventricosus]|uniref:Uncharacterized protein n=1 Tax=Araneus ventricosus TaxID=182803 RepID=A0A4Y2IYS3_ARAVE|nr:hypothetical protein AVEN_73107-1 [Araneus ventricosus]